MFHWICPECGQEIAPGVKECPVCEPQASALPLPSSTPSVAVAPTPEAAAPVAQPSVPEPVAAAIVAPVEAAIVAQEPVPEPPLAPKEEAALEPAIDPDAILQPQVVMRPRGIAMAMKPPVVASSMIVDALPAQMPASMPTVVLPDRSARPANAPAEPETFADRLADLAEHLHGERIPYSTHHIIPGSPTRVVATQPPVVLDVTPVQPLLSPPPRVLLLTEPQPPAIAPGISLEEAFQPRPVEHAAPPRQSMGPEPSDPSPVQLPNRSGLSAAPALASLQDYSEAADRQMRFVDYAATTAGSKVLPATTLPGPALPRELMSLQAAGLVPLRSARVQAALASRHGWMSKYVVVGILLTAGVATYSMLPGSSSSAPPRPTPEPAPEPPVSAHSTHSGNSLARFVEVTGIRFMEVNKKPQIHYLVVNHSSAPLGSVTVYVTLRASNAKPGQPPIARLTFRSPALEAFEAKEMFSSIERASAPVDLPDWQDLHADVEVQ